MKITGFNPLIVTKNAEKTIELFRELGFKQRHNLYANTGEKDLTNIRMKSEDGFYIDISEIPDATMPQDLTLIRMNVDDFEEAYEFLTSKGFRNPKGDATVDTETNRSCMMISPSGFAFDLCQHIRD